MENFWNPVTCFAVCAGVYAISEILSNKTKGIVSTLLFACIIFLAGFWSGLLPPDITTKPGIVSMMGSFGIAILITNVGTIINLEDLCREWKTVVIAVTALVGIAAAAFLILQPMIGRDYAIAAIPPIAGSTVAGTIMTAAAETAGKPEIGAFVVLVLAFQKFFGIPIATLTIRKDLKNKIAKGDFNQASETKKEFKLPSMRIFSEPKKTSNNIRIAKVALVAMLANFVGQLTLIPGSSPANYYLNPNIACLLFGLIFTRIGFLEKDIMVKGNSNGILTLGLLLMLPGSLAATTPAQIAAMIVPVFGSLIIGCLGIALFASLMGKLLGYTPYISTAIGITALLAYPATHIITNECIDALEYNEEVKQKALDYVLPKMIIGGFVTVTIFSVIAASLVAGML